MSELSEVFVTWLFEAKDYIVAVCALLISVQDLRHRHVAVWPLSVVLLWLTDQASHAGFPGWEHVSVVLGCLSAISAVKGVQIAAPADIIMLTIMGAGFDWQRGALFYLFTGGIGLMWALTSALINSRRKYPVHVPSLPMITLLIAAYLMVYLYEECDEPFHKAPDTYPISVHD